MVFCCLAVARCEQAMNAGSSQEAGHYVDAGMIIAACCAGVTLLKAIHYGS